MEINCGEKEIWIKHLIYNNIRVYIIIEGQINRK